MLNYIWCPNGPAMLYTEQFHFKSVITFLIYPLLHELILKILMNQIRWRCHKNYQHKLVLDVPVI
jgi:hypothetical protein